MRSEKGAKMENKKTEMLNQKETRKKEVYEAPNFTKHEPLDSVSQLIYYYYYY